MQTQHISDIFPNVISITQVRKDIDSLMDLLEKYEEVKVLRGQEIAFTARRSRALRRKTEDIKKAVAFFTKMRKKYKSKPGEPTLTEILIRERDRMRTKEYYEEHNR